MEASGLAAWLLCQESGPAMVSSEPQALSSLAPGSRPPLAKEPLPTLRVCDWGCGLIRLLSVVGADNRTTSVSTSKLQTAIGFT